MGKNGNTSIEFIFQPMKMVLTLCQKEWTSPGDFLCGRLAATKMFLPTKFHQGLENSGRDPISMVITTHKDVDTTFVYRTADDSWKYADLDQRKRYQLLCRSVVIQ